METVPLKILLIDGQPGFAGQLRDMLGQAKGATFELTFFHEFKEGLAWLAAGGVDVVLIDLALPDGAGLANVERAQAESIRVPIIVLGNVDDEALAISAVHAGAQDYLVK